MRGLGIGAGSTGPDNLGGRAVIRCAASTGQAEIVSIGFLRSGPPPEGKAPLPHAGSDHGGGDMPEPAVRCRF
jgi:hypothetical protein